MTRPVDIQDLVEDALEAFWLVVAERYPAARSGDLSIERTLRLQVAAETAIAEWVGNNVTPEQDSP